VFQLLNKSWHEVTWPVQQVAAQHAHCLTTNWSSVDSIIDCPWNHEHRCINAVLICSKRWRKLMRQRITFVQSTTSLTMHNMFNVYFHHIPRGSWLNSNYVSVLRFLVLLEQGSLVNVISRSGRRAVPYILWNPKLHWGVHKCLHLDSNLSQFNSATFQSYYNYIKLSL
jgi:hypothetical protein